MTEYRKMYAIAMLCAAVSAAIDELENIPLAWSCRSRLQAPPTAEYLRYRLSAESHRGFLFPRPTN